MLQQPLTDQPDKLREEGSELVTICHRLKLPAPDGKLYAADYAITKYTPYKEISSNDKQSRA